ncbi:F-actin-capping protein subunit alpha-2-like [Spea bombifrons]|uniref:F-actin-capping protein subunit alpha-2-like n=1 Tax=Spea bombifrons TaxID=233779 RepID=UPI002349A5B6|nr:F-actin-capping protein subunit alpha-2-like [Spea bombifrons]
MSSTQSLPRNQRIQAALNLLMQAPPGEFNNVFSDIRVLFNDDVALYKEVKRLCDKYNKDNIIPIHLNGHHVLITRHNEVKKNRFFDPHSRLMFTFNHFTKKASDFKPVLVGSKQEAEHERWRHAFQESLDDYVKNHYPSGVCNVYCNTLLRKRGIVVCIEAHDHNTSAFWNGLWTSEWTLPLSLPTTKVAGCIKLQANYYEGGSIHLSTCHTFEETLCLNGIKEAANRLVEIVKKSDNTIQAALIEEYNSFSHTSLKAMRRQLPVTRSTLDWNKILASRILESKPNSSTL